MAGEPMIRAGRRRSGVLWLAGAMLAMASLAGTRPGEDDGKQATVVMALIVHPKNPATDLKLREARQLLKLDRQFWENRVRVDLYLPPRDTDVRTLLLDKVYARSEEELTRYWVGKVFSGEIPREPSVARSHQAAGLLVARAEGGLAVVPANEVPEGVKVLRVDGKRPGDEGYPLAGKIDPGTQGITRP
jgi:hypothetical protein